MDVQSNVKVDQGRINARLLAKQESADYRRVEASSVKVTLHLSSPQTKRAFVRYFHSVQLNAYYVSHVGRMKLGADAVRLLEDQMQRRIERLDREVTEALTGGELLLQQNGITRTGTYDAAPMEVEVGLISKIGRRFLEVMHKLDRLFPMLETLDLYEVITSNEHDYRRMLYMKHVRATASTVRMLASGLRARIYAVDAAQRASDQPASPQPGGSLTAGDGAAGPTAAGIESAEDVLSDVIAKGKAPRGKRPPSDAPSSPTAEATQPSGLAETIPPAATEGATPAPAEPGAVSVV